MDMATFVAYQHVHMKRPVALDEEDSTNDDGSLKAMYVSAIFNCVDRGGDVTLVPGLFEQGVETFQFYWPDTDHLHEFAEGLDEGEEIVACWQARRSLTVVGHVWTYRAQAENG
jgi:hypothetical protein